MKEKKNSNKHWKFVALIIALIIALLILRGSSLENRRSIIPETTPTTGQPQEKGLVRVYLNGTFSGMIEVPGDIASDVKRLLETSKVVKYELLVRFMKDGKLSGGFGEFEMKVYPPFVPEKFRLMIDRWSLKNVTCLNYAPKKFIKVLYRGKEYTAFLNVTPTDVVVKTVTLDEKELPSMNGSTILRVDGFEIKVYFVNSTTYRFTVLCNGTKLSEPTVTFRE